MPMQTILVQENDLHFKDIELVCTEHRVAALVIGFPLLLSGREQNQVRFVYCSHTMIHTRTRMSI